MLQRGCNNDSSINSNHIPIWFRHFFATPVPNRSEKHVLVESIDLTTINSHRGLHTSLLLPLAHLHVSKRLFWTPRLQTCWSLQVGSSNVIRYSVIFYLCLTGSCRVIPFSPSSTKCAVVPIFAVAPTATFNSTRSSISGSNMSAPEQSPFDAFSKTDTRRPQTTEPTVQRPHTSAGKPKSAQGPRSPKDRKGFVSSPLRPNGMVTPSNVQQLKSQTLGSLPSLRISTAGSRRSPSVVGYAN